MKISKGQMQANLKAEFDDDEIVSYEIDPPNTDYVVKLGVSIEYTDDVSKLEERLHDNFGYQARSIVQNGNRYIVGE